ncbi:MAG: hypothetical protein MJB14_21550 [Spirochaetes bacterium]|nr:hypothetical protein [Spirochaetota bacterium]
MSKKLTFIEEAELKGFKYCPNGLLGNGFYGNEMFITLTEMEKLNKIGAQINERPSEQKRIDSLFFIECEGQSRFLTYDLLKMFPDIPEHKLHNFLNKNKEIFQSQKLFTMENRKRIFSIEAVKFIYKKMIKKEEPVVKKRGRRSTKSEIN